MKDKIEEKAIHFDKNYKLYDNIRPGYPNEIYEIISKYIPLDKNSNILEIGAGNGVASYEINNKWQPNLTLLEPGVNFCELLQLKFKNSNNVKIINSTFERYENNELFDAIFSATAFHWLDLSIKYKKSYEILKNDGLLILFWNNYNFENTGIEDRIQNLYEKYGKGFNDKKTNYERQMEKIEARKKEIDDSNYFKVIEHKIINSVFDYSTDEYIRLLKTFSDHSEFDSNFWKEMEQIIINNGNKINVTIMSSLDIANKL
jgi:SAM-dependent methyltransferase